MRIRTFLAMSLLACCAMTQAAPFPAAPANPCADTAGKASPCQTAVAPVLMVSIQENKPIVANPTPEPENAKAESEPYETFMDRSPLMRAIVWYCAAMAPIALLLLTGITVFEYRKRRATGRGY